MKYNKAKNRNKICIWTYRENLVNGCIFLILFSENKMVNNYNYMMEEGLVILF